MVSSGRRRGKGAPRFCRRGTYVSRQSGATGPVSRTRIRPTGQALESLRSVQPSMPCSTAPLAWKTHPAPQAPTNEKRVCPDLALQKRGWGEMCPKKSQRYLGGTNLEVTVDKGPRSSTLSPFAAAIALTRQS